MHCIDNFSSCDRSHRHNQAAWKVGLWPPLLFSECWVLDLSNEETGGWIPDLTDHGDVESNPGPEERATSSEAAQVCGESPLFVDAEMEVGAGRPARAPLPGPLCSLGA